MLQFVKEQRTRIPLSEFQADLEKFLESVNGDIVDIIQDNFDFIAGISTSLESAHDVRRIF